MPELIRILIGALAILTIARISWEVGVWIDAEMQRRRP